MHGELRVCVSNGMNVHLLFCRYGTNGQETARFEYFWNWIKTILDRGQHSGPVVSSWQFRQMPRTTHRCMVYLIVSSDFLREATDYPNFLRGQRIIRKSRPASEQLLDSNCRRCGIKVRTDRTFPVHRVMEPRYDVTILNL